MSPSMSQVRLQAEHDGHRYELTLTVDDDRLHIEMRGNDADGQLLVDWQTAQPVPAADVPVLAQLLTGGMAALSGNRPAPTLQERRRTHSNSHRPWTAEDDQRLKDLAAAPGATIRDLAQAFGRSRSAIRSRLERLGVELSA
ncbi:winged helix-turn-helix domain-containing protein [Nonomuraea cavernae]|uniref:Uncharacterized protein n=1 Tax=Nonomuraea cavernae TaxID=2045107 RepID=A0A918DS48_9ACTN|nr:winged helix-turn-helix domain-containing protein [Nonomuraea cavernae]MCA2190636.1 winged helix-turn-helix domain-containing protein [Nonomuraea cavernae]GGO81281.1 hypothetical protein GCM10012289_69890 [Nonomuraea cavernae]